ncbi:MAG: hypothetical protein WEA77_06125 [Hyphomonas sp.]|uniref:hypothetical protein n=1 Tax=Hyphomonas sp. TaxID=87 RepID=UPI0034A013D1
MTAVGDELPDNEVRSPTALGRIAAVGQLGSPPLIGRYRKDDGQTNRVYCLFIPAPRSSIHIISRLIGEPTCEKLTSKADAIQMAPLAEATPASRGPRHKTTLAIEALLDGEGEALTRKRYVTRVYRPVTLSRPEKLFLRD